MGMRGHNGVYMPVVLIFLILSTGATGTSFFPKFLPSSEAPGGGRVAPEQNLIPAPGSRKFEGLNITVR